MRDHATVSHPVYHAFSFNRYSAGHPLEGRNLVSMARCCRNDDVLFHDGERYIVVHLTWSSSSVLPFPLFREVEGDDIADFLRDDYLENCEA